MVPNLNLTTMRTTSIVVLGKKISLFESGDSGNPVVLMIHGNSSHSGFLGPVITLLEPKYHIITLDLPGHNLSEAWEKTDFTRENFALLFNAALNHFKITEAHAFGFSMGGYFLLECFDLVPAIKTLAVAGNPVLSSMADFPESYYFNDDSALFLQGVLSDDEIERVYNGAIRLKGDYLKTEIIESIRKTSPSFREGCMVLAQQTGDEIARVNRSEIPIAIIHAADDLVIRLEYLEKLKLRTLWEQKIQIIPDSGHFMICEKPNELALLLDRFFAEN